MLGSSIKPPLLQSLLTSILYGGESAAYQISPTFDLALFWQARSEQASSLPHPEPSLPLITSFTEDVSLLSALDPPNR